MAEEQKKPLSNIGGSARPGEKSQFLHREEIRSMEKDITQAREQETQKERARIAQIQRQQQEKREGQLSEQIRQKAEEQQVRQQQQDTQKQEQEMRDRAEARERETAEKVSQQHQQIQKQEKHTEEHVKAQVLRQTITPSQPAVVDEQKKPPVSPQQPFHPPERPKTEVQPLDKETPIKPIAGIGGKIPSSQSRLIVRLAIIIFVAFIAFNVILFGYWQLQQRGIIPAISLPFSLPFISQQAETPASQQNASAPTLEPTSPPADEPTPIPALESPTPVPPTPSSQLEQTLGLASITLQFGTQQELASLILEAKQITQLPGLVQLVLQKRDTNTQLNAQDFFEVFGIIPPPAVSSQLQNDTLFFIHRDAQGSKFGFVAEISNASQAQQDFIGWEGSLETSLSPLISFWDEKGSGYTPSFREKIHRGIPIRFQTFSLQDIGIVHAFVNNYLIFASSFEGTKALIDELL